MSCDGIDAFCDYCNVGSVITQVTHKQKQTSPCERQSCGLDVKPEVPFREGQKRKANMKKALLLVAALLTASAVHANLVVNPGFETGDFTGWTQFGNTSFTGVSGTFGEVAPHSGSNQAYFGAVGSVGGIEQTISVTPGQTYQISAWVYNFGGTPSEVQVIWGGDIIADVINPPACPYTLFTGTVVATSSTVAFGFQQDPSYFLLDDISVTAVPEPTTTIAGALLLLPFGVNALRMIRRRTA